MIVVGGSYFWRTGFLLTGDPLLKTERSSAKASANKRSFTEFKKALGRAEFVSQAAGFAAQFPGEVSVVSLSDEGKQYVAPWGNWVFDVTVLEAPMSTADETRILTEKAAAFREGGFESAPSEWETFLGHKAVRLTLTHELLGLKQEASLTGFFVKGRYYSISLVRPADEKGDEMSIYSAFRSSFRLLDVAGVSASPPDAALEAGPKSPEEVAKARGPAAAEAAQTTNWAGELTLALGNKVTMKLVQIPAGKFTMGSPDGEKGRQPNEGPQREVTISKAFYMGECEVTQAQYVAIMGKNPSAFKDAKNPVEKVSWNDAVEFCKALTAKTGKTVRLPTEAEWEYACRAGTKTRFSFGDADADLHKYGNYCDKSNTNGIPWQDKEHNDGHDKTAPVGSYKPNAWGLYDMHGDVYEWCGDWYADSYASAGNRDPQGPDSGSLRVLRGGGWYDNPRRCRSARRHYYPPVFRRINYGFRVVSVGAVGEDLK